MLVASDAGIRGSPLRILPAEVIDYMLLELILQVQSVKRYTQSEADLLSVVNALCWIARAVLVPWGCFLLVPQAHGYPDDFVAGFLK